VRLFVALDLPTDVRATLAAWADTAAPATVRRVPAENLHVTLAFLGSRDEAAAAATARVLPQAARPLGPLHTVDALWLAPRRPSVLTVALAPDRELLELHAGLVDLLTRTIGFEPEARPFRAHVTVGRVPRGARIDIRRPLEPPAPQLSFDPPSLTLSRSHTASGGARYEPLERVDLR
jgi:2'-5' RNA ligase